ncbi:MAG: hypothetical protein D3922_11245, partial [Candidatus Electrothrix sp. AR1]|nr:hypothetical protein [Candidatus Electrothrix sp. AR1]
MNNAIPVPFFSNHAIKGGEDMLARLNKTITLPAALFFLLSTVNQLLAETSQRTVTLQKMQCGSGDIETINRQILDSKIDSDAILILPEGEFNVAPLT